MSLPIDHPAWDRSFRASMKRKRKISDSVLLLKPIHPQKNPKSNATTQKRHQKFDYTTIADRLVTVSWSNDSHPNRLTGSQPSYSPQQVWHDCAGIILQLAKIWICIVSKQNNFEKTETTEIIISADPPLQSTDRNNNNNVYSEKRHMLQLKIWNNNIRFGRI